MCDGSALHDLCTLRLWSGICLMLYQPLICTPRQVFNFVQILQIFNRLRKYFIDTQHSFHVCSACKSINGEHPLSIQIRMEIS